MSLGMDRVVPFAVECSTGDGEGVHLRLGDDDAFGILGVVKFASHGQT